MPQITIYVDENSSRLIEGAARKESLSLSRWARNKLVLAAGAPSWPEGYEKLLGSISDSTFKIPEELNPELDATVSFDK